MRKKLLISLKRHATEILADLPKSKEPILITEHGRPSAFLADAEDYENMQQCVAILEGIACGEKAIADGKTVTNDEVKERLCKWLK